MLKRACANNPQGIKERHYKHKISSGYLTHSLLVWCNSLEIASYLTLWTTKAHLTVHRDAKHFWGALRAQTHQKAKCTYQSSQKATYRSTVCIASRKVFPPRKKRYDEYLTLVFSLGSWNDISSCLFITSSPWQYWQDHPYCWHFPPPSHHCHPRLLWLGSLANVAIYKNSWDSSADKAFLNCHYRFNRHTESQGVLTICLCTCEKEGELQSAEPPPSVPICLAPCVSQAHTIHPGWPWMLNTSAKPISNLALCHKSVSSL